MPYSDKYGEFFGRFTDDGNVAILHVEDGAPATRLDASVYPVGSAVSARYEHPGGIVLTQTDVATLGIEVHIDPPGWKFVLCRSDDGHGGWSLHAPGSTNEQIASGDAAISGDRNGGLAWRQMEPP